MSELRHRISMRFKNARTEAHFVKSHSKRLLDNFFWLAVVAVLTLACLLFYVFVVTTHVPDSLEVRRARLLSVASKVACLVVTLLAGIATKVPSFDRCVSPEMKEILAVLVIMFLSLMSFLMDLWYGPKLLQYDPSALWATRPTSSSDTRPMLALSVMMTASHVALPIRWIVLLSLDVFSVMVYAAFAFIVGGPDGLEAWSTLVLYTALVICAAIGRRTIENYERETLLLLITERSLRAETEFRLTRLEGTGPQDDAARRQDDQVSTRESRPETTASAKAVVNASQGGGLEEIIEIGKHENWLVDPEEVDLMEDQVLGSGGFGKVVAGGYAGTPVAVKMMPHGGLQGPERDHYLASFLNEVRILRRLRHPSIVMFFGSCLRSEDSNILLILEWVHGPCLEKFILEGGVHDRPLMLTDQLRAAKDVCLAMCHLHSRHPAIIHGDLKGNNIIMEWDPSLANSFRAKLLDFGLSRVLTRHAERMGGTLMWVAPELVQNPSLPANKSADVFSFSRLSFFVLTGVFPFSRRIQKQELREILKSDAVPPLPWPRVSSSLIADWRPWIEACSACNPTNRPAIDHVRLQIMQTSRQLDLGAATGAPPARQDMPTTSPEGAPSARDATDLAFASNDLASFMSL